MVDFQVIVTTNSHRNIFLDNWHNWAAQSDCSIGLMMAVCCTSTHFSSISTLGFKACGTVQALQNLGGTAGSTTILALTPWNFPVSSLNTVEYCSRSILSLYTVDSIVQPSFSC